MLKATATLCLPMLIAVTMTAQATDIESVNVYSFRKAELIQPLIDQFTKQSGIKVHLVSGKANALLARLTQDGERSLADVLLTVDVARLEDAKVKGLLAPVKSGVLQSNIPVAFRDHGNYWFGLSIRARTIFVAKDRVPTTRITSYQDLALPQWRGKLCVRKGSHYYNRSMVAAFIYHDGIEHTQQWVNALSSNLAQRPNGGDRDQLRNLAAGYCDIAIANSYYYGMLATSHSAFDRSVYDKVSILWPNQKKHGTHLNISGAAVTKASKNKANAIKFIEFLTTPAAQKIYSETNYEYPIRKDVLANGMLRAWGGFIGDEQAIAHLSSFHEQAKKIIKKSNW